MGMITGSQGELTMPQGMSVGSKMGTLGRGMGRYKLTVFFAITAALVIAVGSVIVNHVIRDLPVDNVVRIAEENATLEVQRIESLMRAAGSNDLQESLPADLESLIDSSSGVLGRLQGLDIVKFNLLNTDGALLWSARQGQAGLSDEQVYLFQGALAGQTRSRLVDGRFLVDMNGVEQRVDVAETYIPVTNASSGEIVGVLEVHSDVTREAALQVDGAKSALRITMGTMAGLVLVLLGFVVVADVMISRSSRRELSLVEEANRNLEERARERAQELERANQQLVEAQDQLVRTERLVAIGQLSGSVAHDLRNPLGAINNAIYYLRRRLNNSEAVRSNPRIGQFLQIIEDEVQHSNQIITDLMNFARAKAPSLSPTNLETVIEDTISTIALREDVRITRLFESDLPAVPADADQLLRVFMNLIVNAQDAMPDGGELTINANVVGNYVEVGFRDRGMGIPNEDMKKIFDPLFTTKTQGTGLGLAICQQIISKHGGTIDVSGGYGQGATFTVKLPRLIERSDGGM